MAIDLPPVMPPQLATQEQIQQAERFEGAVVERRINGVLLRVMNAPYLSAEQLQALLAEADSPSAAITALGRRYYSMGQLLVSLQYYRIGDTVTVMVDQSRVQGLRGNPRVTHFFGGLVGDADLQLHEFDRARVPANIYSQRAGLDYQISYEHHPDQAVILDFIEQSAAEPDAGDLGVEVNNQGSRFLGRYFAQLDGARRFSTGTELRGAYRTVVSDWGEARDGDDYHQFSLGVDQPLRYGVYGIEASHIQYKRRFEVENVTGGGFCLPPLIPCTPVTQTQVLPLEAEISEVTLQGEQLLYSNPLRRLNLFERLSYVDSEISPEQGGDALLDEKYAALEVGARYTMRETLFGKPAVARVELAAKVGLSDDDGSFGREQGNDVAIGRRSAEFLIAKPAAALNLSVAERSELRLSFQGQWVDDVQLPQQQQWVLGGSQSLSAWLPGTLIGDDGYLSSVALQRRYEWGRWRLVSSIFVEYGSARFSDNNDELGDWQSLADAGVGLTLDTDFGLQSRLLVATSIHEDVSDEARLSQQEADFFWTLRWQL